MNKQERENLKLEFYEKLKELMIADGTINNFKHIFSVAAQTEDMLDKDVCEFNSTECDELLKSYPNRSKGIVNANISRLKSYMTFCIEKGCVPSRTNWFATLTLNENRYLNKGYVANQYITREELTEMQDKILVNERDRALLELLFVGVRGQELEEIRNLTKDDVLPNRIVLPNRKIPISERTYNILQGAIEQTEYLRSNGNFEGQTGVMFFTINPSQYVIRPAGKNKIGVFNKSSIRESFGAIKKYVGNPFLSPNNIFFSGLIDLAKQCKEAKGEVSDLDWENISEIYNINNKDSKITKRKYENLI
ncbi:MAG TPA: hypothetical protein VIK86_04675 [Candidatus Paceibacterota bacterium]